MIENHHLVSGRYLVGVSLVGVFLVDHSNMTSLSMDFRVGSRPTVILSFIGELYNRVYLDGKSVVLNNNSPTRSVE